MALSWSAIPCTEGDEDDATSGQAPRRVQTADHAPLPPDGAHMLPQFPHHLGPQYRMGGDETPDGGADLDGGEWFYYNHLGHKQGPYELAELQEALEHEMIPELRLGTRPLGSKALVEALLSV